MKEVQSDVDAEPIGLASLPSRFLYVLLPAYPGQLVVGGDVDVHRPRDEDITAKELEVLRRGRFTVRYARPPDETAFAS